MDLEVTGLTVSGSRATITFRLDDQPGAGGAPLDRLGRLTEGAVSVDFALGQLSAGVDGGYLPFTVRADAGVGVLEGSETGFETVDVLRGEYRYVFSAPLAGFDASRAQTVVGVATRTRDGVTTSDRGAFSFLVDGGVPVPREQVLDAKCTSCHGQLAVHAARFDTVAACAVCHAPGATDPATGNSLELGALLHRLHRGATLPSVVGGGSFTVTGASGALVDYSGTRFPQSIKRCEACHGGAQGAAWQTKPSLGACLSCHDTLVFTGTPTGSQVLHPGAVSAASDCAACHQATTGVAPIVTWHLDPSFAPTDQLTLSIDPIAPVAPGNSPSFTFRVQRNGAPLDILSTPLARLAVTLAGPNTEPFPQWSGQAFVTSTIQGAGAVGTLVAVDAPNGVFRYVFSGLVTLPASATGSYSVGLEGYLQASPTSPRFPAVSPVRAFAVTDAVAQPRRTIVENARCEACHFRLEAHGQSRVGVEVCTLCHGPDKANDQRVARLEDTTVLAESVDLKVMVHKLHAGAKLTTPYTLYTSPTPTVANPAGTPIDGRRARYPRALGDCEACHRPGTYGLPLAQGRRPSVLLQLGCSESAAFDTNAYCNDPSWTVTSTTRLLPETAVCTSCHDSVFTAAHAQLNTTASGFEACATCHGAGATWDVSRVHRP